MGSNDVPARRCWWCGDDPLYQRYHDQEWGFPVDDDRRLFEKLCLEGFQAGLSWITILRKREAFREAFAQFEGAEVAAFGAQDVERLLQNSAIVRHRGKIEATLNNAQRLLELYQEFPSLADYVWRFEPTERDRPKRFDERTVRTLATSPPSERLAKDLKKRGWRFVGPTTAYAFMQSMGLVNDHVEGCPTRARVSQARQEFTPPHLRRR